MKWFLLLTTIAIWQYVQVTCNPVTPPQIILAFEFTQEIPEMPNKTKSEIKEETQKTTTKSEIKEETQKTTTKSESNDEEGKPATQVMLTTESTNKDTKDSLIYNNKSNDEIKENITQSKNEINKNQYSWIWINWIWSCRILQVKLRGTRTYILNFFSQGPYGSKRIGK